MSSSHAPSSLMENAGEQPRSALPFDVLPLAGSNATDYVAVVYALVVCAMIVGLGPRAQWHTVIPYAAGVALVAVTARLHQRGNTWGHFFHLTYPLLFLAPAHYESGLSNQLVHQGFVDATLVAWDHALFGAPLYAELARGRTPWLTELMSASYVSFYVWITGMGLSAWFWRRERMDELIFAFTLCMYGLFLWHRIWPAVGPTYLRPTLFAEHQGWFGQVVVHLFDKADTPGGAFPSGHCAGTVVLWGYSWRLFGARRAALTALPAALLCLSTVYLCVHYAVDALVGVAVGVGLLALAPTLHRRLSPGA